MFSFPKDTTLALIESVELVAKLQAENARLREELASAEKVREGLIKCYTGIAEDAKRYRWLVAEKSDPADLQIRWDYCYNAWSGCDGADGFTAVIDDAIAEENGK